MSTQAIPASIGVLAAPSRLNPRLSLALQGGGAFGAFTWGVLDRILETDIEIDAVSGASAGAVNAVLLAEGLRRGGAAAARQMLEAFWTKLSSDAASSFVAGGARSPMAFDLSSRMLSPYQLNPFNVNPLRTLLARTIDFEGLRADPSVRLLVAATAVSDGQARIFREDEISLDAVMASACLPLLHQAVEIEGQRYWDGGYAANPPLLPLIEASEASRVLLVQIIPTSGDDHPTTSPGIVRRLNQITFNSPLHNEVEAIAAMKRMLASGEGSTGAARKLSELTLDQVSAEDWVRDLSRRSVVDLDRGFIRELHDRGRTAAAAWLGED